MVGVDDGLDRGNDREVWLGIDETCRDRRTSVEWSSKKWRSPMFGRKVCGQVCSRTLERFLRNIEAGRATIQENGQGALRGWAEKMVRNGEQDPYISGFVFGIQNLFVPFFWMKENRMDSEEGICI